MIRLFGLLVCVGLFFPSRGQVDESRLQAVEASVQIQENPPRIILTWPLAERPAVRYRIAGRPKGSPSWSDLATVDGGATSWTDSNVTVGQRYEYRIIKETNAGYLGHSYLMAGIQATILEDTGTVLILARDYLTGPLATELQQLENDLFLEGWNVVKLTVNGSETPTQVREKIRNVYGVYGAGLKSVILVGHVAVPYSGNIVPDGHDNHKGAWPADGFYADMDGTWTDSTVNTQTAERAVNWNVPGDGKFDQNTYPTTLKVAVGRIDFFEMTCYANKPQARSELDLMKQYLNKNHAFRSGQWQVQPRGLILDNFGLRDTNGVAATAWMNFAAFFGASANSKMELNTYFTRMKTESALWSWTGGGGSYYYSSGVGTSDDFALTDVNVVFSLSLGSYFGDWNNESNWIKAALGSGKILVSLYSGIPRNFFHGMALGGTIGESFLLTQNNRGRDAYLPDTQGTSEVHQALLGDPTLRMWPRESVAGLIAQGGRGQATLSWNAANGAGYAGVHVYRSSANNGPPMTRITTAPVTGNSYTDVTGPGTYLYMVRPVWLQSNGSGSFYNLGQGARPASAVVVTQGEGQNTPPTISASRVGTGTIRVVVAAPQGKTVTLESSSGFGPWSNAGTAVSQGTPMTFDLAIGNGQGLIFRAQY